MDSILMVFWPKGVTVSPAQHHRIEQVLGRHGGLPVGPQPFKNDALPRGLGMHQHQAFRRLEQGELLVQSPQILEICGKILFHPPFRAWRGIRTGTRLLRKIQPPLGGRHLFQGNGPDGKDRRWSRSTLGAFRGRGKHWNFRRRTK